MATNIREANSFWIEAGAMSGPPSHRHQIEFSNELAEFFDEESREAEIVYMRFPGSTLLVRPLTYRGTDYGQWTDIWRLGLPTERMGGQQYAGRIIKFNRLREGNRVIYEITIADQNSQEGIEWERMSRSEGRIGTTGGPAGRRYGFW